MHEKTVCARASHRRFAAHALKLDVGEHRLHELEIRSLWWVLRAAEAGESDQPKQWATQNTNFRRLFFLALRQP